MHQGNLLPNDVIAHWPEIFGDIKFNAVPLGYLNTVQIKFKDGKVWEIRITTKTKRNGWQAFQKSMEELCRTYEHSIEEVDFKLDPDRVRKDIEKMTQKFLKRSKL